jgi:hypothetical protein
MCADRHRKRPCYLCSHYVYSTLTEVFLNLTEVFLNLTEGFPCFFLSCKANARVKLAKTGHDPHSSTLVVILCCSVVISVVLCIVCV